MTSRPRGALLSSPNVNQNVQQTFLFGRLFFCSRRQCTPLSKSKTHNGHLIGGVHFLAHKRNGSSPKKARNRFSYSLFYSTQKTRPGLRGAGFGSSPSG